MRCYKLIMIFFFVSSFWLFNSSSFFVCHFFLACQLTCLSPLQSNHFNAGKKCHIHSESREWNVNQINKHRQILIWSEILLVFVINFVLVEQKLRSLNFSVSYFHLNSQKLHFFISILKKIIIIYNKLSCENGFFSVKINFNNL